MLRFEMYQETQGILNSIKNDGKPRDWRWRLIGKNGEPIANGGEGYRNKDQRRSQQLQSLQHHAADDSPFEHFLAKNFSRYQSKN